MCDFGRSGSKNAPPWSLYKEHISKVIIEKGVTDIGNYAFSDLDSLKEVSISDSVTAINEFSFYS